MVYYSFNSRLRFKFAPIYHQQTCESPEKKAKKAPKPIRNVLTNTNTRDVGMDSLSAKLKIVSRENRILTKKMERVAKDMTEASNAIKKAKNFDARLKSLQKGMKQLKKDNAALEKLAKERPVQIQKNVFEGTQSGDADNRSESSLEESEGTGSNYEIENSADIFENAEIPDVAKTNKESLEGVAEGKQASTIKISTYSQPTDKEDKDDGDSEDEDSLYLPAGSILTGVLINGMDAPTSQGARKDPFPSTLRIQKEAILPNRFRADVRECFLIVSGYGDLSSERVYLRGETFSCIREDGSVIEARLNSYAVGEDGKAGLRGRVVSKQGQIIAKSLLAGFASGISEAFNTNPVQSLATNPGAVTQFQSVFSTAALQGGASKGASKALDRIAQFYIDIAEGIFPVVEIDAGRQVDIILTKGAKLNIRSKKGAKK